MAYNSAKDTLEEAEQFNMQCHRTSKLGWKAPSICMSMSYPNYDLVCQNDIDYVAELEKVAEQVAAESLDESVDDYVADVLNDIYQLYYNFYWAFGKPKRYLYIRCNKLNMKLLPLIVYWLVVLKFLQSTRKYEKNQFYLANVYNCRGWTEKHT